jgi:multiple sugar transport system permease protein
MRITKTRRFRQQVMATAIFCILTVCATVFLGPFLWMITTSLKHDSQVFSAQVKWLPTVPTVRVQTLDSSGEKQNTWVPRKLLKTASGSQAVAVLEEMPNERSRVQALTASGKPSGPEFVAENANIVPTTRLAPQWHNYPEALSSFPFWQYLMNTLFVCLMTMTGTVLSAALPAYGFSRLRWPGRDPLFFVLIMTIMLPAQVTMLPVFLIFRWLGWTGTFLPLIVPPFLGSAFSIFLLRQFFMGIPQELSDAARIDGCSELGILGRVIVPMAKPAIATVALFAFTYAWMDFLNPLIYLHDERHYTLAIGLQAFLGRHGGEWSLLMAAATVITLPMLVIFFFAQRTFIQGIALTGLKG